MIGQLLLTLAAAAVWLVLMVGNVAGAARTAVQMRDAHPGLPREHVSLRVWGLVLVWGVVLTGLAGFLLWVIWE